MSGQNPFQSTDSVPQGQFVSPDKSNQPYSPRPNLALITIPLYISAGLYGLIGIASVLLGIGLASGASAHRGEAVYLIVFVALGLICCALAAFICLVAVKVNQRKKWAWIAAIVLGAMYAPSLLIFLGVPILIGCFKTDVNHWFNSQ